MMMAEVYDPVEVGKDYIVQVKIKNGPLLRALRNSKFKTAKALADAAGCTYQVLIDYLALRRAPIGRRGQWSENAILIAGALKLPPDCLWPEQHLEKALKRARGEVEMSADEIKQIVAPEESRNAEQMLIENQEGRILHELLARRLSPREERVIRQRFGFDGEPKTLEEVAQEQGVNKERIRQIEARAIRRLRGKKNWEVLKQCGADKLGFERNEAIKERISPGGFVG